MTPTTFALAALATEVIRKSHRWSARSRAGETLSPVQPVHVKVPSAHAPQRPQPQERAYPGNFHTDLLLMDAHEVGWAWASNPKDGDYYLRSLRALVDAGRRAGLPPGAVEAKFQQGQRDATQHMDAATQRPAQWRTGVRHLVRPISGFSYAATVPDWALRVARAFNTSGIGDRPGTRGGDQNTVRVVGVSGVGRAVRMHLGNDWGRSLMVTLAQRCANGQEVWTADNTPSGVRAFVVKPCTQSATAGYAGCGCGMNRPA